MPRLKALKPATRLLPPRIGYAPGDEKAFDRQRAQIEPWRRWYKTARWIRLREATLSRDTYTCRMCGRLEARKGLMVCDHIKPHRGDQVLFWDPDNLQTLCKSPCHDKHKQLLERGPIY